MKESLVSCIYEGVVVHTRLRPRRHMLRRRIPMMLFDLDELVRLKRPLLGVNRGGPLSLQTRHHLAGDDTPLKTQIEQRLAAEELPCGGPVRLLCMPAVFGQVFNPLSVYFCHGVGGALSAIVYEVNNTFGARHCYVLPAPDGSKVQHACEKAFRVSPFLPMDLTYAFAIEPPGGDVRIGIQVSDADGLLLSAAFSGTRRPLTSGALAGVLLRHPLLMFEVLFGIHWEALKMLLKGISLKPGPRPAPSL